VIPSPQKRRAKQKKFDPSPLTMRGYRFPGTCESWVLGQSAYVMERGTKGWRSKKARILRIVSLFQVLGKRVEKKKQILVLLEENRFGW